MQLDCRVLLSQRHNPSEILLHHGLNVISGSTSLRRLKLSSKVDSGDAEAKSQEMKPLDDENAMLCPGIVRCIIVSTQTLWLINADNLKKVDWKENIFLNQLVLKQNKKDMLKGLVRNHLEKNFRTMGDFIAHKGRGLIIVLHGPPGTGKTFAAESLAEYVHRPLLALSIGDLIADSKRLEERLEATFSRCREWGAILLLDEADVVLEARSIEDVRRNGIVSGKLT
jgi:DNA replication protein DnaC